jgi:hypothetical protein
MSLDATRWAWKIQNIRPLHKLILLALADRADSDDTAWPSYQLLTADTGVDRKTTWQAIKSMKAAGLLVDTGERKGKTRQVQKLRLIGVSRRSDEIKESQKRSDSENGTVPFFPEKDTENGILNSSENGIRNLPIEPTKEPAMVGEQGFAITAQPEPRKVSRKKLTLAEFMESSRAAGVKVIPDGGPIWEFAEKAGIDEEMIRIAWIEFKRYWLTGEGRSKRRTEWRATFLEAVRRNRGGIWRIKEGETAQWTTAGEAMRREAA